MHRNGSLRRPLWFVIKSIGGQGRVTEQWRELHARVGNLRSPEVQSDGQAALREEQEPLRIRRRFDPDKTIIRTHAVQEEGPDARPADHDDGRINSREKAASLHFSRRKWLTPEGDLTGERDGPAAQDRNRWQQSPSYGSVRRVRMKNDETQGELARETRRMEAEEGYFDSMVQRADEASIDHKTSRWANYKDDEELRPRYFNAYRGSFNHRLQVQTKRWQNQRERYGVEIARNWRSILDLLDKATPDGESRHKRRMETVSLPEGLRATWTKNAGEVVLELMQRTGSHLQALPGGGSHSFGSVSLWGTPAENDHARLLLPEFVEAANDKEETVSTYKLSSKVNEDLTAAQRLFDFGDRDKTDETYWREQEDLDVEDNELLAEVLGEVTNAPTSAPAPVRAVWAPSNVRSFTRPTEWNLLTFTAYVDALTTPRSRLSSRSTYGPQPTESTHSHVETMSAELVRIFRGAKSGEYASSAAFNIAVGYLAKHNDFPAIRKIFLALEDRQFDFTTSNFTALFQIAAREESVPNFLYTLRLMIQKGLRPTASTWETFHLLMDRRFPLESNIVTETMRRKGLFANLDTVRSVASGSADRALEAHLAHGKGLDDFLTMTEARYGDPRIWLSSHFVNKTCRVLLGKGRVQEAFEVVGRFENLARGEKGRQGIKADTLNTFLSSTMRDGDIESAIAYVRAFMPPAPSEEAGSSNASPVKPVGRFSDDTLAIQPDHVAFFILFSTAWKRRYYNVSRVLWRRACAQGMVSYDMQHRVRQSLQDHIEEAELKTGEMASGKGTKQKKVPNSQQKLWRVLGGKFVVGVGQGLPRGRELSSSDVDGQGERIKDERNYDHDSSSASTADQTEDGVATTITPTSHSIDPIESAPTSPPTPHSLLHEPSLRSRRTQAKALLEADMAEAGSVQPVNSLLHDLERAWRVDAVWKEEGLGKMAKVREGERLLEEMFKEMMRRGVKVPMVVGDVAGVAEVRELAKGSVAFKPLG